MQEVIASLSITALGRTVPDLEAGLVFGPDEWRAAFILNKKPVPKKMPTLNEVIRLIAQRGGFLVSLGPRRYGWACRR